jgi:metallo-beta-lactamase family protein
LYEVEDVAPAEKCIRPVGYGEAVPVTPDIEVEFVEAGHILGSALNKFTIHEKGRERKVGFAFDLGRRNMPVLKDPDQLEGLDILIIESTYGNRVHEPLEELEARLADIIKRTYDRGGKVIIPSFSLGRTQELQHALKRLYDSGTLPQMKVYVDSPLAQRVSEVFRKHAELFDAETNVMGSSFLDPGFIHYVNSKEESQALNTSKEPCIIISASGMCESGRVLHHLIHNAPSRKNTILFVGFLAQHTLGRKILEGQTPVHVYGRPVPVNAEVVKLNAFSAHAGRDDLLNYIKACGRLEHLVLVHGEESQIAGLAEAAKAVTDAKIVVPKYEEEIDFG